MLTGNLFSDIPAQLPGELTNVLLTNSSIRLERIVSKGHCSPEGFWYDQEEHEWVLVVQGKAILQIEEAEPIILEPGMHINLPAHVKHRVVWTSEDTETIWLALFYSD